MGGMVAGFLICALIGHKWRVDDSTELEPVFCCDRCGRKTLAPSGSAFSKRVDAETARDRAVGPFRRRYPDARAIAASMAAPGSPTTGPWPTSSTLGSSARNARADSRSFCLSHVTIAASGNRG